MYYVTRYVQLNKNMVADRLVIVIVILGFHGSEKQIENEVLVIVHSKITGPPRAHFFTSHSQKLMQVM